MSEKIFNMVDLDTIEKLAQILSEKNLGEITIADGEKTISVKGKKCPPPPPMGGMPPMPPMGAMPPMNAAPPQTAAAALVESTVEKQDAPQGKVIKAPLVGTFYAAPSPDQPPFVKVGDSVKKGDVILIIESMKLMNEVTSDTDGVVTEILVKNGDAVEYDQPLMVIV